MGFVFTLTPVLEARKAAEEKAQREYGVALEEVEARRREQREYLEEAERRRAEVRAAQMQGQPVLMRELYESWIAQRRESAERLTPTIHKLHAKAEQFRLALVKVMQARLVLEKLREREYREWLNAEERSERRRFDEIAIRNYAEEQRRQRAAAEVQELV